MQVLLPMASYTDYWLPAEESSRVRMYYLTLASQICERLGNTHPVPLFSHR